MPSGGPGSRGGWTGVKAQGQRAPGRVRGQGSGGLCQGEGGVRGKVTAKMGVPWAVAPSGHWERSHVS